MRQVADKSYSVRQQHFSLRWQLNVPQRGIEGSKHPRAFQHSGLSECVEQRGFPGVGVAHQCDDRNRHGFTALALLPADAAHVLQLLLHVTDAAVNLAAIGFELSLARAARADTATELRHFHAAPGEAREQVFQLRQFHLQLAFASSGVTGENVEYELGTVDNADAKLALQVALL